jgi:hypothetical protein
MFAVERATRFGCRVKDFGFTSTKSAKKWLEENRELNEASLENFDPMTPVKWTNLPQQTVVDPVGTPSGNKSLVVATAPHLNTAKGRVPIAQIDSSSK